MTRVNAQVTYPATSNAVKSLRPSCGRGYLKGFRNNEPHIIEYHKYPEEWGIPSPPYTMSYP
jgi:hypothetical protein